MRSEIARVFLAQSFCDFVHTIVVLPTLDLPNEAETPQSQSNNDWQSIHSYQVETTVETNSSINTSKIRKRIARLAVVLLCGVVIPAHAACQLSQEVMTGTDTLSMARPGIQYQYTYETDELDGVIVRGVAFSAGARAEVGVPSTSSTLFGSGDRYGVVSISDGRLGGVPIDGIQIECLSVDGRLLALSEIALDMRRDVPSDDSFVAPASYRTVTAAPTAKSASRRSGTVAHTHQTPSGYTYQHRHGHSPVQYETQSTSGGHQEGSFQPTHQVVTSHNLAPEKVSYRRIVLYPSGSSRVATN